MASFGCEYREGRAAAALLLRPHGNDDREGGHPVDDPLPSFIATMECEPHDPNLLPHLHSADDIAILFPSIGAAPGPLNAEDYTVGELKEELGKVGLRGSACAPQVVYNVRSEIEHRK